MRRAALICAALLVVILVGEASQSSGTVTGRVVNREGVARPRCLVEFRLRNAPQPLYSVYTDARGNFSLSKPRPDTYRVTIVQGRAKHELDVTITAGGMNPSVLRVPW